MKTVCTQHLPSFNYLLKLHVAILSIREQLDLAATFIHAELFFILPQQIQTLKFFPLKKWNYAEVSHVRFKNLSFLTGSYWPEMIEGFYTKNLCPHLLTCRSDLA